MENDEIIKVEQDLSSYVSISDHRIDNIDEVHDSVNVFTNYTEKKFKETTNTLTYMAMINQQVNLAMLNIIAMDATKVYWIGWWCWLSV